MMCCIASSRSLTISRRLYIATDSGDVLLVARQLNRQRIPKDHAQLYRPLQHRISWLQTVTGEATDELLGNQTSKGKQDI